MQIRKTALMSEYNLATNHETVLKDSILQFLKALGIRSLEGTLFFIGFLVCKSNSTLKYAKCCGGISYIRM